MSPYDKWYTCPACNGWGYINDTEECTECEGKGEIHKSQYKAYLIDKEADKIIKKEKDEKNR